jgi:hypothetical protein
MKRWTAGWNMPGYLPESEPVAFDTWAEAHAYIVGAVERAWDEASENLADLDPDTDPHPDALFLDAHTELHVATDGQPYTVHADGYAYWVAEAS